MILAGYSAKAISVQGSSLFLIKNFLTLVFERNNFIVAHT
jgi:hypothetical protein